jgi:two-component system, OmpR family, response regulator ResD
MKQHILIVDDEAGVRDVVSRYLEREGYAVSSAGSGPEALHIVETEPDLSLVVLDIMLPGLDGVTVLKRIREKNAVPVILLSARTDETDRISGLESGADDYVPKPFSPRELVSRVKAVLRRVPAGTRPEVAREKPITVGTIELDPNTRQVNISNKHIELTAKEFELLWFLMRHPKQVFTREQLLEQVWGFAEFIDISTVTVHMHRLREKIEADPKKPRLLATVWGVGYRLTDES